MFSFTSIVTTSGFITSPAFRTDTNLCSVFSKTMTARRKNPSDSVRYAVYARDKYRCQICGLPTLPYSRRSREGRRRAQVRTYIREWIPTLDHIVPWHVSHDNSMDNPRTAHKWCNERRANNLRTDAEIRSLARSRWSAMSGGRF